MSKKPKQKVLLMEVCWGFEDKINELIKKENKKSYNMISISKISQYDVAILFELTHDKQ